MMAAPVKVFLPSACLAAPFGYLLGTYNDDRHMCYITALVHSSTRHLHQRGRHLIESKAAHDRIAVVGVWTDDRHTRRDDVFDNLEMWIELMASESGDLPLCCVTRRGEGQQPVMVVMYNVQETLSSYYLKDAAWRESEPCNGVVTGHSDQSQALHQAVHLLLKGLRVHMEHIKDVIEQGISVTDLLAVERHCMPSMTRALTTLIYGMVHLVVYFASLVSSARLMKSRIAGVLCRIPTILCQWSSRHADLKQASEDWKAGAPKQQLRSLNSVWRHVLDVAVGLLLLFLLLRWDVPATLATSLMHWADNLVSQLQQLFVWLMGSPAGLKLNSKLDQFLGRFFLYHIHLWTAYLQLLRPVLVEVLWWISVSGVLGVSTQLSLTQDLFSMMTLHLYCFYVYAARLYSMQMYGLQSLWRVFRGKKWNVLRKRVDTAVYDVDQLFVGTLLFTILLFLLPTTAMYYVVFTTLRLLVVITQGVLHKIVCTINHLPVYSLMLKLSNSASVSDRVIFQVLQSQGAKSLFFSMQLQSASVCKLWGLHGSSGDDEQTHSWADLISCLLSGRLIYPWVKQQVETVD